MVAEIKQYANTVIIEILLQNINGSMMIMVLLNYLVSKMLLWQNTGNKEKNVVSKNQS